MLQFQHFRGALPPNWRDSLPKIEKQNMRTNQSSITLFAYALPEAILPQEVWNNMTRKYPVIECKAPVGTDKAVQLLVWLLRNFGVSQNHVHKKLNLIYTYIDTIQTYSNILPVRSLETLVGKHFTYFSHISNIFSS